MNARHSPALKVSIGPFLLLLSRTSTWSYLKPLPPSPLAAAVNLIQGTPVPGYRLADVPLVQLELSDHGGEFCTVVMYPEMARSLSRVLTHCGVHVSPPPGYLIGDRMAS